MEQTKKSIKGIGEVIFVHNPRSTNIRISLRPGSPVRISAPPYTEENLMLNFLEEKKEWINSQQQKIEQKTILFLPGTNFKTHSHHLVILHNSSKQRVEAMIGQNEIRILVPTCRNIESNSVQLFIKKVIIETLRKEAKIYLPQLIRNLANQYGFHYNQIAIKNLRSKWGSCSGSNNLNFNLHLMRLPDPLIRYVVLHELAHTVVKNHGPKFWKLLDSMLGNAHATDSLMKKYHVEFVY